MRTSKDILIHRVQKYPLHIKTRYVILNVSRKSNLENYQNNYLRTQWEK